MTAVGSVASGILASTCCIGPVVFAMLGLRAEPPMPSFWMHPLERSVGADHKLCLNPPRFTLAVIERLERLH